MRIGCFENKAVIPIAIRVSCLQPAKPLGGKWAAYQALFHGLPRHMENRGRVKLNGSLYQPSNPRVS